MFEGMAQGTRAVAAADAAHVWVGQAQRALLRAIAEVERTHGWRADGARDLPHWVSMRYGISWWKAQRWVGAARALEELPRVSEALCSGELSLDKVAELCRFATPETEDRLVRWAKDVSVGAIRHRGDKTLRASREELVEAERTRSLERWYSEDGRWFDMLCHLPVSQGTVVDKAIDRWLERVPVMPEEQEPCMASAREADALVALCSASLAADPDPDRGTVVVHVDREGAEIEDGPALFPETAERLACDARVQVVVEDASGDALRVSPMTRVPPAWMVRQVRHRDRGCRFPGCGTRAFTHAHHIVWWGRGGRTELSNLLLVCSFHHRLVHEHGWRVRRDDDGQVRWLRPDGTRYRAGPSPWARSDDEVDDRKTTRHPLWPPL
jgi:hypothetical protein